jgi:hypothetical protein
MSPMIHPIKLLHVFSRTDRGGAEMRTLEVLRHADRSRYEFHFCTLSGEQGELDDELRSLGATIHSIRSVLCNSSASALFISQSIINPPRA